MRYTSHAGTAGANTERIGLLLVTPGTSAAHARCLADLIGERCRGCTHGARVAAPRGARA